MFEVSDPVDENSISLSATSRGGRSIYSPIIEKLEKIVPGKVVVVSVPRDTTIETMHGRLNNMLRKQAPPPPEGYRYTKATTDDGRIAIGLKEKWRPRPGPRAT